MSTKPTKTAAATAGSAAKNDAVAAELASINNNIAALTTEFRDLQTELNVLITKVKIAVETVLGKMCERQEPVQPKTAAGKFPYSTSRDMFIKNFRELKEQFVTKDVLEIVDANDALKSADPSKYAAECYKHMATEQKALLKTHWAKCRDEFETNKNKKNTDVTSSAANAGDTGDADSTGDAGEGPSGEVE